MNVYINCHFKIISSNTIRIEYVYITKIKQKNRIFFHETILLFDLLKVVLKINHLFDENINIRDLKL